MANAKCQLLIAEFPMDFEISAGQVNTMLKHGEKFTLLDVREPWGLEKAKIACGKNIPMGDIATRAHQELDPEEHIVVICHDGIRSLSITNWLRRQRSAQPQS